MLVTSRNLAFDWPIVMQLDRHTCLLVTHSRPLIIIRHRLRGSARRCRHSRTWLRYSDERGALVIAALGAS